MGRNEDNHEIRKTKGIIRSNEENEARQNKENGRRRENKTEGRIPRKKDAEGMRKKKEAGQMKTKEEGRRNNEYTLELPHLRSGGFIVTFGALVLLKA